MKLFICRGVLCVCLCVCVLFGDEGNVCLFLDENYKIYLKKFLLSFVRLWRHDHQRRRIEWDYVYDCGWIGILDFEQGPFWWQHRLRWIRLDAVGDSDWPNCQKEAHFIVISMTRNEITIFNGQISQTFPARKPPARWCPIHNNPKWQYVRPTSNSNEISVLLEKSTARNAFITETPIQANTMASKSMRDGDSIQRTIDFYLRIKWPHRLRTITQHPHIHTDKHAYTHICPIGQHPRFFLFHNRLNKFAFRLAERPLSMP